MLSTGLVAFVTGSSRGIGAAVVEQLTERGVTVVAASRSGVGSLTHGIGSSVLQYRLDFADTKTLNDLDGWIQRHVGKVDILVNNAGVYLDDERKGALDLFDTEIRLLQETFEVNFFGAARLSWMLMPQMVKRGFGRVVNVSSGMGRLSEVELSGAYYRLSKLALNGLTKVLAARTGKSDVLVNAVCPGWVRTDMGGSAATRSAEEGAKGIVYAALLPTGGVNGCFLRDGGLLSWC